MISKSKHFRSNGKLLLTAEYLVLDGAKALALPTKYGQSLVVEPNTANTIIWNSYNELGKVWFEDAFSFDAVSRLLKRSSAFHDSDKTDVSVSERLLQILKVAQDLNPEFLNTHQGYAITTHQDFNRLWGLGTSSTLINNIANWAKIDAYALLKETFGGSGYDIACAQHNTPIRYQLTPSETPKVHPVVFNPAFKNQLYFVYLNQKQNSRDGIAAYKRNSKIDASIINEINTITEAILVCKSLLEFENLISSHETIISKLLKQETIKAQLFKDFNGSIKSLGAWGGDFVLVTSKNNPKAYFSSKGFETIIPYSNMILN